MADLVLQDEVDVVTVQVGVLGKDLLGPRGMLLQRFGILGGGYAGHQCVGQIKQLLLQAAGQNGQTHDLDEADVLFLDVVELGVGVVDAQRVLRNNITTPEHPLGVYHPHAKLHHIKKENIGLIEVMGLAVLPSRLKAEMADVEAALVARTPAAEYGENIQKHAEWAMDILARHPELNAENVHTIVQDEIGHVFAEVLVDAGVYKMDTAGRAGFERFLANI